MTRAAFRRKHPKAIRQGLSLFPCRGSSSVIRIGKDAVSRVAAWLEAEISAWRSRPLGDEYPYLYVDTSYHKVNWGGGVVDLALLVAVGVNREVLAVEPADGEKGTAFPLGKHRKDWALRGYMDMDLLRAMEVASRRERWEEPTE